MHGRGCRRDGSRWGIPSERGACVPCLYPHPRGRRNGPLDQARKERRAARWSTVASGGSRLPSRCLSGAKAHRMMSPRDTLRTVTTWPRPGPPQASDSRHEPPPALTRGLAEVRRALSAVMTTSTVPERDEHVGPPCRRLTRQLALHAHRGTQTQRTPGVPELLQARQRTEPGFARIRLNATPCASASQPREVAAGEARSDSAETAAAPRAQAGPSRPCPRASRAAPGR